MWENEKLTQELSPLDDGRESYMVLLTSSTNTVTLNSIVHNVKTWILIVT